MQQTPTTFAELVNFFLAFIGILIPALFAVSWTKGFALFLSNKSHSLDPGSNG